MRKVLSIIASFLTLFILFPSVVLAQNNEEQQVTTLAKDEVYDKDYFAAGDVVEIYGTVNGDVYAAGGQLIVDGVVNGDLLVAGGTIDISGVVAQDVRVAGGQIKINGEVGQNLTIGGGQVDITENATIGGSITAGAGNLTISAPVGKDLKIGAGNIVLANKVLGDAEIGSDNIRFTPDASITGNLTYWGTQDKSTFDKTQVGGTITQKQVPEYQKAEVEFAAQEIEKSLLSLAAGLKLVGFISFLIVGLLLVHFYPNFSSKTVLTLKQKPWMSLGIGFVVLVLTPIAFLMLLLTLIGIPIAFILMAAYLLYLYLSKFVVMLWAGEQLLERATDKKVSLYQSFILGLIVFTLLTLIPVISGFINFFSLLLGLGAMLLTCKAAYQKAKSSKII